MGSLIKWVPWSKRFIPAKKWIGAIHVPTGHRYRYAPRKRRGQTPFLRAWVADSPRYKKKTSFTGRFSQPRIIIEIRKRDQSGSFLLKISKKQDNTRFYAPSGSIDNDLIVATLTTSGTPRITGALIEEMKRVKLAGIKKLLLKQRVMDLEFLQWEDLTLLKKSLQSPDI